MTEQVARRQDPRRGVVEWLKSGYIEAEIKRALPDHVPVDWFLRCAQTALLNNPNLANANKESLLRELVAVAQLGLVTDPQLGEAWLIIDRHGMVQRRVGYQGLRKLALQSGLIHSLNAQAVYRKDKCSIALGDSPHVKHEVDTEIDDRGDVRGYYAVARVAGVSEPVVEWMSKKQVDEHRDRYSDAYRHPDPKKRGPWADPLGEIEMGRKTVFRRIAKWLPKSPILADALANEDRQDMRDVTPETGMLPAPDEPMDDMDRVVAEARVTGGDTRQEPAGAPAAEPRTDETAAEAAPPAGRQQRAAAEPSRLRTGLDDGPPLKRKPGRPSKAETEARQRAQEPPRPSHELEAMVQERTAQQIIAEINATDPDFVDDVLATHKDEIANLPDELRTEIVATAHERQALADDGDLDDGLPPDLDPGPDPLDAEGKPPVGETSGDDGFDVWCSEMEAAVGRMDPAMRAIPARKTYWLRDAKPWGERGAQAVEAAFAR